DHEVHVFTSEVDEPRPQGIVFHLIPTWKWKSLTYILSFIVPATVLVRGRFDIIHAQGLCGMRQHVTTAHMCQAAWYAEQSRHLGPLTWPQRLTWALLVALERLTYREAISPQVIAISEANRQALRKHYQR